MIDKITTVEAGVRRLLDLRGRPVPDFRIESRPEGEYHDILIWNGQRIPLFDTHFDARLYRMAAYGNDAEQNCTLNVYSFVGRDIPMDEHLYRELDIAELLLHSPIQKLTAFIQGYAVNLIAVTENTCCANMDLGCGMAPGSVSQFQHRLITQHGMTSDRGAGILTENHQINIYSQDSTEAVTYDDNEFYLYGLNEGQVAQALAVHAILTGKTYPGNPGAGPDFWKAWEAREARLQAAVRAVHESDRLGRTVTLEEVCA